MLPSKLKHIPASNVILPPDAQRVVILVMEVGVQIQQRLAQRKVEQLCLFCRSPYRLDTLAGGRRRAQPGDALNGVKHGNIIEVLAHQALVGLVGQEQVLQKYRLTMLRAKSFMLKADGFWCSSLVSGSRFYARDSSLRFEIRDSGLEVESWNFRCSGKLC